MPITPYTESDFTLKPWIEECGDIICPYCGQDYRYEILMLARMRFCPNCGHEINLKPNTMKLVKNLNHDGKCYQVLYKGRPVADIQLEQGNVLTRAEAYEVVKEILCKQRPGMMIEYALVSYIEME